MTDFAPKRILCPVDFSEHSAAALRFAGGIAKAFNAEVIVLHVQRLEAPVYFTVAQTQALKTQLHRSTRAAQKHVREFAGTHLDSLAPAVLIVEDDPVAAILKTQQETGADLIAMGTHGRGGLARLELGSVAESILRQAKVPVVTVGPHVQHAATLGTIHRVLCPVNYKPIAHVSLAHAAALAAKTNAELLVVHIEEQRESAPDSLKELCGWISPDTRGRCAVKEVVRQGIAAEQIVAEAESYHADLLVIGAQPRTRLQTVLLGSTTELVIRNAPCPVLSVIGSPLA